jgi:hypothetical protein
VGRRALLHGAAASWRKIGGMLLQASHNLPATFLHAAAQQFDIALACAMHGHRDVPWGWRLCWHGSLRLSESGRRQENARRKHKNTQCGFHGQILSLVSFLVRH